MKELIIIVNEKIKVLIDERCLFCVPTFIREYMTKKTCEIVARDYPELYNKFINSKEEDKELTEEMRKIVNNVLSLRVKKHIERRDKNEY